MRVNWLLIGAAGLAALLVQAAPHAAAAQTRTTLDIYVVDVEGGNATLFVSPSGESLLIDTGNVAAVRDAGRIMAAAKDAGLAQIDHLIITHWHSEILVHALRPRVAIMNDGTRKGGQPEVMKTVHSSPGLEDLWQIHFSLLSGQEYTVAGMFIANLLDERSAAMPVAPMSAPPAGPGTPPPPAHDGPAYWIKVSARADGTFTVTNARNRFSKTYAFRKPGTN